MSKIKIIHGNENKGYFTKVLDDFLKKKSSFKYPRSCVIRPSSISDCTRKIVCDILGFLPPEEITPKQQRTFDNGDSVHKRYLGNYLPRIGCAAKILTTNKQGKTKIKDFIEITLRDDEYWIKCRPDAVIINHEDKQPYVLEVKSMKDEYFQILEYPSESYIQQVHLYMHVTGIPRAIVFYENKNNQDIKEFLITLDQTLLDQLLLKIRTIQKYVGEYVKTKQLPEKCNNGNCIACREIT